MVQFMSNTIVHGIRVHYINNRNQTQKKVGVYNFSNSHLVSFNTACLRVQAVPYSEAVTHTNQAKPCYAVLCYVCLLVELILRYDIAEADLPSKTS